MIKSQISIVKKPYQFLFINLFSNLQLKYIFARKEYNTTWQKTELGKNVI